MSSSRPIRVAAVQQWSALEDIPADVGRSVVTLGNFDGVHRGHRAVLNRVIRSARERGCLAIAVTFDPHPLAVLHPERAPAQITGLEHRLSLLADVGLDAVLVLPFTRGLARQSARQFVESVFVEALHAKVVVVGTDTRFGIDNSGDISTMRELGAALGFEVDAIEPVGDQAGSQRLWSSTRVREALAAGDVTTAATILGRPHRVSGEVVHGHHRGRELGFPTANLGGQVVGLVPADGVYAGWLERFSLDPGDEQRRMPAAISVGTNPTFDDVLQRTVEAYVLDRDDLDLYHEQVGVDFVQRLRGNDRFESIEALLDQMGRDVAAARSILHR